MPFPLNKRWAIAPRLPSEADRALNEFHPILRQILYNRGNASPDAARAYLEARPPQDTDPRNMLGVPQTVDRILTAIRLQEPIAIYGDYDVDGVTATALLIETLRSAGAQVQGYIPNRFDEGYGLNNDALEYLHGNGTRLVITVDCGIRSVEEADHARRLGLDLIISDHHHPGLELPNAFAVINPKQTGDEYPDKDLAGVGLAYKIACGLAEELSEPGVGGPGTEENLDLVALGTVADLAPLVGENRSLVRRGLKQIRQPHRQGLMALIGVSGLSPRNITATDIGFALGPRLNAAGRLESALSALSLLTSSQISETAMLAQQLEIQNRERQQITRDIQEHAEQALIGQPDKLLIYAAHPTYNPGVVGLVAARLNEAYYRPAIVAHIGEEYTRASCRSIPEFHITKALDQCADLLEHHGGHAAAAGFTVKNENVPLLLDKLSAITHSQLAELDLRPTLQADMEISLTDLRPELLEYLAWLQPTGYGNPQAYFVSRNLKVSNSRVVGKDGAHLKLSITDGRITYDAIAFRQGYWHSRWQESPPKYIDLFYAFETNEFNGRTSLQLNVRDIKSSD